MEAEALMRRGGTYGETRSLASGVRWRRTALRGEAATSSADWGWQGGLRGCRWCTLRTGRELSNAMALEQSTCCSVSRRAFLERGRCAPVPVAVRDTRVS